MRFDLRREPQKDSCKAAQGKCSFPWDGIGLAHKRQLRFHRAVCKTAISPERCIIAPFILKGFERCCVRERHAPSLQAPAQLPVDGTRFSKVPSPDHRSVLPDRPESFPAFRHGCKDDAHALSGSAPTSCVQGSFPGAGKSAASAPLWLSRCGDRQGWFSVGSWHHAPLQNKKPNNQICFVLIVWLGKTCMIFAVYSNSFRKSFIYVFDKLSRLKIQLHRIWQSSITISILRGDYVTVLSFLEAYRGIFSICLPLQ